MTMMGRIGATDGFVVKPISLGIFAMLLHFADTLNELDNLVFVK